MLRGAILAVLSGLLSVATAAAHDLSHSQSEISVRDREARSRFQLDLIGFGGMQWRAVDKVSYNELDASIEPLFVLIKAHLQVTSTNGAPAAVTIARYGLIDDHVLDAQIVYRFEQPPADLVVRSTLDRVTARDHQHLVTVDFGAGRDQALLTAAAPAATFSGTSRWRSLLSLTLAGAKRAATSGRLLPAAGLIGLGATSATTLRWVLLALAIGTGGGMALTAIAPAGGPATSFGMLEAISLAALAFVTLLNSRTGDHLLLSLIFAMASTLSVADTQPAQAPGLSFEMGAYSIGAAAAIALCASAASAFARDTPHATRIRQTLAVLALGLSAYWLMQPSVRG